MERKILRGDMYYADLSPVVGSEQGGFRPVLIIQNNVGNKFSPTVVVAAITSKAGSKAKLPTHIALDAVHGLGKDSLVLLEQVRTIDQKRLNGYIGRLDEDTMEKINQALAVSFSLRRRESWRKSHPNTALTL